MKPIIFRWLVFWWGILAVNGVLCHAFSFGEIRLHSQFGDPFLAEVELFHEVGGVVEIEVGSPGDYQRLQLDRPALLDELNIVEIRRLDSNSVLAQIASESPLFYPSFNLILKANHKGGTLLESYLITVDFQSSLSLGGSSTEKDPSLEKPVEKEDGALVEAPGPPLESKKSAEILATKVSDEKNNAQTPMLSADVGKVTDNLISKGPTPQKGNVTVDTPLSLIELESPRSFEAYTSIAIQSPSPLVKKDLQLPLSFAEGIFPRLPPGQMSSPPLVVIKKSTKSSAPGFVKSMPAKIPEELDKAGAMNTLTVQWGESLSSIALKLDHKETMKRVVVALWMDNRDSFIFGNMNGLKVKSVLKTDNLSERLKEVTDKEASRVYANQLREWKYLTNRGGSISILDKEPPAMLLTGPSLTQTFSLLREWRSTWETADLERHWDLFSMGASAKIKKYKEVMFRRHKEVQLAIGNTYLVLLTGGAGILFDQEFSSSSLSSVGQKEILLTPEKGAWKIREELFYLNRSFRKKSRGEKQDLSIASEEGSKIPYTVHLSSHANWEDALSEWKHLSKNGIQTFISPYSYGEGKKFFRILSGRFRDRNSAVRQANFLKGQGVRAVPWLLPYVLKIDSYSSEKEANRKISELWKKGIPCFLLAKSQGGFTDIEFQVIFGSFEGEKDVANVGKELVNYGISYEVLQP